MGPQQTLKVFSLLLIGLTEAVVPGKPFSLQLFFNLFTFLEPALGERVLSFFKDKIEEKLMTNLSFPLSKSKTILPILGPTN